MFSIFGKKKKRRQKKGAKGLYTLVLVGGFCFLCVSFGVYQYVLAASWEPQPLEIEIDPNLGVREKVIAFFEDNEAHEMVRIIKCESQFKHYEMDGSVLKNREGSSAIGVAQILQSKHPDPKVIKKYNRLYDMDLTAEDFDITTLNGNLGYALMLYQVRGTRDWECAKRFHF